MNSNAPFLSIIVPAYNVEDYIRHCVDSILQQTFTDFELILVDDGAKDNTGKICDEYAVQDERVKVIHKENGGLVSARKAGLKAADGRYVAYVDGDDWIASDMFSVLCGKAAETGADIVISDFVAVGGTEEKLTQNMRAGFYSREDLIREVYPSMLCAGEYFSFGFQPSLCSRIFRKELLFPYQMQVPDQIRLGEDAACSYACLLSAEKIVYLKESWFYYYRMRTASISHAAVRTYYTEEILILVHLLYDTFKSFSEWWELLKPQLYFYICYMLDNMITPHLTFKELFFSRKLKYELQKLKQDSLVEIMLKETAEARTSSRMKRILHTLADDTVINRLELFCFCVYERGKRRFGKHS